MSGFHYCIAIFIFMVLTACGSGSGSGSSSSDAVPQVKQSQTNNILGCQSEQGLPELSETLLGITGAVSYQYVPVASDPIRLDFARSEARPIRYANVEALEAGSCEVVGAAITDAQGEYKLSVPDNIAVKIRVVAFSSTPDWQIAVADNTQSGAVYAIYGESLRAEDAPIRDLHAATGWTGNGYGAARLAAPFYLLDQAMTMLDLVVDHYPSASFEPLNIFWSVKNSTQAGDDAQGNIASSKYYSGANAIYFLGLAGDNTDEFDINVVNHELAHFVVDSLGRSDGLGGRHSLTSYLEPRSAYSEGVATAIAGLVSGDNLYIDTGLPTGGGWSFGIDQPSDGLVQWHSDYGWYNEGAITELVFDLFDQNNEGMDVFSLPLSVLFTALARQKDQQSSITVYSLLAEIVAQIPTERQADLQILAGEFGINVVDDTFAVNEVNDTRLMLSDSVLPLYSIVVNNTDLSLCFDRRLRQPSSANELTGHRLVLLKVSSPIDGELIFSSELSATVYRLGEPLQTSVNGQLDLNLVVGNYVVDLFQRDPSSRCYNISFRG
ncbi:hypothetical protein SIN8267_00432 [Sinobacterium norvegicum]|uniref:Lipoprotein n=1 Tax=Sinobacterium norvegicum TaxID=1641715 RepID=A0ABN8EF78_9GAMM|nr:hypothetical protein [Sinobacterium norvegicum]CAH0990340.1 hypothetical protein SIN8267_00432 [Sinobacterium norvegicum]